MANLNLDRARTAVLSMDIQKATVRRATMFRERRVGEAAKSVLDAARRAGVLVVHVVIDYQPAFFSVRNKFLQKIRIPVLSAPGVDVAELLEIADEVKPVGDEPILRKPRMNPFFGTALESMLRSRDIDTVVMMGIATEFVVESAVRHAADADRPESTRRPIARRENSPLPWRSRSLPTIRRNWDKGCAWESAPWLQKPRPEAM